MRHVELPHFLLSVKGGRFSLVRFLPTGPEVAVLVLVFVPLEKIVNKSGFGVGWAVGTLVVIVIFLSVGIILEWSRL